MLTSCVAYPFPESPPRDRPSSLEMQPFFPQIAWTSEGQGGQWAGNGFNTAHNLKQPIINIIRHNHFALSKFASNAEQWYPYKPVLVHLALHAKDKCGYLAMTHMNELGLVHSNTFKTEQHGCVRHSSYSMSLMSLETDELSIVPHLQWFQHTAIHLAPHHRNKTCTKRRYALCRLMTTWATSSGN